jgi:hypothetical protein
MESYEIFSWDCAHDVVATVAREMDLPRALAA